MDVADRIKELEELYLSEDGGWRAIKALADPHGIEKPEGGWDDAISLIAEAEAKAEKRLAEQTPDEEPQVEQAVTSNPKPTPTDTPWRKPRTDLYGNLIPNPWSS